MNPQAAPSNKKKKAKGANKAPSKSAGKPAAQSGLYRQPDQKLAGSGTHVTITNSEVLTYLQGGGASTSLSFVVPVFAGMVPWLAAISAHFQVIRFKKINMRYVPRIGTQASGTVYIAPLYLGGNSGTKAHDALGANAWIKSLSGAVAQSVSGVADELKAAAVFILKNAARTMFKTAIVAFAGTPCTAVDPANDVLSPGSFAVLYETTETAFLGEIIVDYTVELSDPSGAVQNSLEVCKVSTTPATLELEKSYAAGGVSGNIGAYQLLGNEVRFTTAGVYNLTVQYVGSSPVLGNLVIYDRNRVVATDKRSGGRWDISSQAVVNLTVPYMQITADAGSSTAFGRIWMEAGDQLVFPTLTSGTMTVMCFYLSMVTPDLILSP
jgi:hypothetical protein